MSVTPMDRQPAATPEHAAETTDPALFQAFPALKERIPWRLLPGSQLPTPAEPLPGLDADVWIKRDDRSNSLYGGNKSRKLAFILPHALATGRRELVTFGAIGTNHGVATAAFCRELGLDCHVLLFDQPVTDTVRRNLLLMQSFGAQLRYSGSLKKTVLGYYSWERLRHPRAYFLFAGGSSVLGCLAFVSAAFELRMQIESGILPEPARILCPVGSGATLAGLTLGCALAGLNCEVTGIRVGPSHLGPFQACTEDSVAKLLNRSWRYLQSLSTDLPAITPPRPRVDDSYVGPGYGASTAAGDAAMAWMHDQKTGLALEPTYTAKAFAAVRDASCNQAGPILYWHTYNSADMSAALEKSNSAALPQALRSIL